MCTLLALAAVAVASLGFGLNIGFTALAAGAALQLMFPKSSSGAERQIAWSVVLLVCGIVTYVNALQRYGTVDAAGAAIAGVGTPLVVALLLCAVGAVTSAFASSAGILGAMTPLAAPLLAQGAVGTTGLVTALAVSATVVDAMPFSTVGALVVANASEDDRALVYRGLIWWGDAHGDHRAHCDVARLRSPEQVVRFSGEGGHVEVPHGQPALTVRLPSCLQLAANARAAASATMEWPAFVG